MKGQDLILSPHQLAADKHRRHGGVAAQRSQRLLDITAPRHQVQLVHRRINPKVTEQWLDGVAHAATTLAEDHRRLLRHHSAYSLHILHYTFVFGTSCDGIVEMVATKNPYL